MPYMLLGILIVNYTILSEKKQDFSVIFSMQFYHLLLFRNPISDRRGLYPFYD